jgi:hypothetical protein
VKVNSSGGSAVLEIVPTYIYIWVSGIGTYPIIHIITIISHNAITGDKLVLMVRHRTIPRVTDQFQCGLLMVMPFWRMDPLSQV